MTKPKYDINDTILCYLDDKSVKKGVISMITITRKGIRYRVKVGYDQQIDVWEEEVIGGAE